MSSAIDYFRPRGEELTAHVDGIEIAEVDFSEHVTSAEITDGQPDVSFWVPDKGKWTEDNTNFELPEPELLDSGVIRFTIDAAADLTPGKYGVKVIFDVPNTKRLISDHILKVRGALSE